MMDAALCRFPITIYWKFTAVVSKNMPGRRLPPAHMDSLDGPAEYRIRSLVINYGIEGPHGWRFICGGKRYLAVPICTIFFGGFGFGFNCSQHFKIPSLQHFMGSCSPGPIKNQLQRTQQSNKSTKPYREVYTRIREFGSCGCTGKNNCKAGPPAKPIKPSSSCDVILRIAHCRMSQCAYFIVPIRLFGHVYFPFLFPPDVGAAFVPWERVFVCDFTPAVSVWVLLSFVLVTPTTVVGFLAMLIVSIWLLHVVITGPDDVVSTRQGRILKLCEQDILKVNGEGGFGSNYTTTFRDFLVSDVIWSEVFRSHEPGEASSHGQALKRRSTRGRK